MPPRRPLVLLVEDDASAARGLARMLGDDGFDVERVGDGAAAVARLDRLPLPEALITDLYIPYVDGLSVARFAHARSPSMLAIVVTGHAELLDARSQTTTPALTIFAKPLDYARLLEALHALLPAAA